MAWGCPRHTRYLGMSREEKTSSCGKSCRTGKQRNDVKNYLTRFNGGKPFGVRIGDIGVFVYHVTEAEDDDEDNDENYKRTAKQPHAIFRYRSLDGIVRNVLLTKPIFIKALQIFVPEGVIFDEKDKRCEGSSILLRTGDKEYVYIGEDVHMFKTSDRILEYHSPVNNSDVAYPYAIGTKFVYFITSFVRMPHADIEAHMTEVNEDFHSIMYRMSIKYTDSHTYSTKTIIPRPY